MTDGDCVDCYAAGEEIATIIPNGKYTMDSGTSLSTPFVVGFVATLFPLNSLSDEVKGRFFGWLL